MIFHLLLVQIQDKSWSAIIVLWINHKAILLISTLKWIPFFNCMIVMATPRHKSACVTDRSLQARTARTNTDKWHIRERRDTWHMRTWGRKADQLLTALSNDLRLIQLPKTNCVRRPELLIMPTSHLLCPLLPSHLSVIIICILQSSPPSLYAPLTKSCLSV